MDIGHLLLDNVISITVSLHDKPLIVAHDCVQSAVLAVIILSMTLLLFDKYTPWVGLRGSAVERRSLAGELSLSCARPVVDG